MTPREILRCKKASSSAEFALTLPLLLLLFFGMIDGGRLLFEVNRASKAAQAGVRYAAVTNMVASGVASYKFAVSDSITPGTPVPISSFDSVTCSSDAVPATATDPAAPGCAKSGAGPTPGFDDAAFTAIGDRMRAMYPAITDDDFTITYKNVGLGYAGNPYGPDVSPEVTVSLRNISFVPISFLRVFAINIPISSSSMPLEDGVGTQSN